MTDRNFFVKHEPFTLQADTDQGRVSVVQAGEFVSIAVGDNAVPLPQDVFDRLAHEWAAKRAELGPLYGDELADEDVDEVTQNLQIIGHGANISDEYLREHLSKKTERGSDHET